MFDDKQLIPNVYQRSVAGSGLVMMPKLALPTREEGFCPDGISLGLTVYAEALIRMPIVIAIAIAGLLSASSLEKYLTFNGHVLQAPANEHV